MATKLNINPSVTYSGVLDFDASSYIQLSSLPDVDQNIRVTFKMYLTKESGYSSSPAGNVILTFYDNVNNARFVVGLKSSDFYVTVSGFGAGNWLSSLSGHSNKIIEVEIIKSAGGSDWEVNSVTFNGASQTDTGTNTFGTGGDVYTIGSFGSGSELDDAYIWDINVYNSGDTLIHSWAGHPSGNLDSSWEDQTASIDGTVSGNSPFFTSDITGTGGGSVSSMSKKLELDPSSNKGVLLLSGTFVAQPFLTFTTDASTRVFDPGWSVPVGDLNWDLGDGSIITANAFSHTYTQTGDKTVKVYLGTVSSVEGITNITMFQDDIKGTLDFSEFSELSSLNLNDNPGLTEILVPTTTNTFSILAGTCDLTGTLDISSLINLNQFNVTSNSNLTSIIFPSNPSGTTSVGAFNCNLTGTIDVSGLDLTGQFTLASNTNLTQLLLPSVNTGAVTSFYLYGCPNCYGEAGVFDWSGWSDMGGQIHIGGIDASVMRFPTSSTREWTSLTVYGTDVSILDFSNLVFHPTNGAGISANTSPNLAQIAWPDASIIVYSLNMSNCNFSGSLDLSSVQLGRVGYANGYFYLGGNEVTQILHKDSSAPLDYRVNSNHLTGTLDVSGLTGIYRYFWANQNPSLNDILLPDFSDYWSTFRVDDCSLSQFTVDDIFAKMNTYYTSNSPTSSLEINTSGGGNSPPTDGSSNANILSLESIFNGALQALSITINNP